MYERFICLRTNRSMQGGYILKTADARVLECLLDLISDSFDEVRAFAVKALRNTGCKNPKNKQANSVRSIIER